MSSFDQAWGVVKAHPKKELCERCQDPNVSGPLDEEGICGICRDEEGGDDWDDPVEEPIEGVADQVIDSVFEEARGATNSPGEECRHCNGSGQSDFYAPCEFCEGPETEMLRDSPDQIAPTMPGESQNIAILARILGVSENVAIAEFERVKYELFGDAEP